VVEDKDYTYIIMDFCEDGDLFTQILHQRRYLGQDELIKHVFLQLLDAVEYCHSLGIYHRDLKPENVLCFDGGLRLAITDFGLATMDTVSEEFRTGSAYHMSPECHGGPFAPSGTYSPLFNDVWSLGIILLNLLTGRNPWKSASLNDPTFYAYLQDPARFLPTVLPISDEVNELLVRTLEVDWRKRLTLSEMKEIVKTIDNFYSDDAVFEGSMARCTWELGMDVGSDAAESQQAETVEAPKAENSSISRWSSESKSDSEMVFATQSATNSTLWRCSVSNDATCGIEASMRSTSLSNTFVSSKPRAMDETQPSLSQSTWSVGSRSPSPSLVSYPATPNDLDAKFETKRLTINTAGCNTGYYRNSVAMKSAMSGSLYTAMESSTPSVESCTFNDSALYSYSKPSSFEYSDEDMDDGNEFVNVDSADEDSSSQSERAESPIIGGGARDSRAMDVESWRCSDSGSIYKSNKPWTSASGSDSQASLIFNDNNDKAPAAGGFFFDPEMGFFGDDELDSPPSWPNSWTPAPRPSEIEIYPPSSTKPIDIPMPVTTKPRQDRKRRKTSFFRDHIKLSFPRSSPSASLSSVQRDETLVYPPTPPLSTHQPICSTLMAEVVTYGDTSGRSTSWARRGRFGGRLSSRRKNWLLFSPGKLFGAAV
jgi:serine/threonine protein kinase